MDIAQHLAYLDELVAETFTLWDQIRVGFSWRCYYLNHTRRVRALCATLGRRQGADLEKLVCAATLHDLTKRYEGAILVDSEGKRLVDREGLWRTEILAPARANEVTRLYDAHDLHGQPHHQSGAALARILLERRGFPTSFCDDVATIILAHLQPLPSGGGWAVAAETPPPNGPALECAVLYDADTLDANLGYVALYRHVQILGHRLWEQTGREDLPGYLDRIPEWMTSKGLFVERMKTTSGRAVAQERYERSLASASAIEEERRDADALGLRFGLIGVIDFFLSAHHDPDLAVQLAELQSAWIPERRRVLAQDGESAASRSCLERASLLSEFLAREVAGEA